MTLRHEYARAAELRAQAADRGAAMTVNESLRLARREPVSRLRMPFRELSTAPGNPAVSRGNLR